MMRREDRDEEHVKSNCQFKHSGFMLFVIINMAVGVRSRMEVRIKGF